MHKSGPLGRFPGKIRGASGGVAGQLWARMRSTCRIMRQENPSRPTKVSISATRGGDIRNTEAVAGRVGDAVERIRAAMPAASMRSTELRSSDTLWRRTSGLISSMRRCSFPRTSSVSSGGLGSLHIHRSFFGADCAVHDSLLGKSVWPLRGESESPCGLSLSNLHVGCQTRIRGIC